jgi:hypothetical protein
VSSGRVVPWRLCAPAPTTQYLGPRLRRALHRFARASEACQLCSLSFRRCLGGSTSYSEPAKVQSRDSGGETLRHRATCFAFCELLAGQGLHAAISWLDELATVEDCDGGECVRLLRCRVCFVTPTSSKRRGHFTLRWMCVHWATNLRLRKVKVEELDIACIELQELPGAAAPAGLLPQGRPVR